MNDENHSLFCKCKINKDGQKILIDSDGEIFCKFCRNKIQAKKMDNDKKYNETIDYDVVDELLGHKSMTGIKIVEAAKDIFNNVKERAMECAFDGKFISFETERELCDKLVQARYDGVNIKIYDQDIGG